MSLIINRKIRQLMVGYPTISDKYDVVPATLEGSNPVAFGRPVMFGTVTGNYAPVSNASAVSKIAGFVLATNVALPATYPASENPLVQPNTAFNLFVKGGIAVELDNAATVVADIKEGAQVYINLSTGALGTSDSGTAALPNTIFTGVFENHGTEDAPVIVAEIKVLEALC